MRRFTLAVALAAPAALSGCMGTSPDTYGSPDRGISAVVIGGKIVLPSGETSSGKMWLDFEGENPKDDRVSPELYRLTVRPQQSLLYQVEPGTYHYAPARSVFGFTEPTLTVKAAGHTYHAAFPRDILRRFPIVVKPTKIVSLGVLEAVLSPALPGRQPTLKVRLDDSVATRRKIIQDLIHNMMDPNTPTPMRESAVAWTRALDQTLEDLTSEALRAAPYKPGP
jgi:hypothetical protein